MTVTPDGDQNSHEDREETETGHPMDFVGLPNAGASGGPVGGVPARPLSDDPRAVASAARTAEQRAMESGENEVGGSNGPVGGTPRP